MPHSIIAERSTMITTDIENFNSSFADDVNEGLNDSPKHIPCLYFYDYKGSLLFEEICQLPEYYLTRTETEILKKYSKEIIYQLPDGIQLIELGSANSIKTELIIEEMLNQYDKVSYSPIDISIKRLKESSIALLEKYDNLEITSVAAKYDEGLPRLNIHTDRPKLIIWLGSSIGNFCKEEAILFLKNIVKTLSTNDFFLIGFDLHKDKKRLEQAYNDSRDVTAEFNLNLLSRINRELGGEFDLNNFKHQAVYNEEKSRIEMYLISTCEQKTYIADLNKYYHFRKNERIHTENSHKYSLDTIEQISNQVGMEIINQWFDSKRYFNLTLFKPIDQ